MSDELHANDRRLLALFAPKRYIALSEAQAAELGSDTLGEWRDADPEGHVVAMRDYATLIRDAARWGRLCRFVEGALIALGCLTLAGVVIGVLAVAARWWS